MLIHAHFPLRHKPIRVFRAKYPLREGDGHYRSLYRKNLSQGAHGIPVVLVYLLEAHQKHVPAGMSRKPLVAEAAQNKFPSRSVVLGEGQETLQNVAGW